jgi:hypothetical protein
LHCARGAKCPKGAADNALGAAVSVHLGRIQQAVADIQRMLHGGDFLSTLTGVHAHLPGPKANAAGKLQAAGGCMHGADPQPMR